MSFGRPVASLLILMPSLAVVGCGSHTGSPGVAFTEPHVVAMTEPGGSGGNGGSGGGGSEGSGGSGGHTHGVSWPVLGEKEHVRTPSGEFDLQAADFQQAQASGFEHVRVRVEVAEGEGEMRPSDWFVLPAGGDRAPVAGDSGPSVALRPGESFEMTVDFPVSSQIAEVRYAPSGAGESTPTAGWVIVRP